MELTYRNSFLDILWFNYYQAPRTRSTQIIFGFFLLVFGYTAVDVSKHSEHSMMVKIIIFIVILVLMLLVIALFQLIYLAFLQMVSPYQRLQVNQDFKLSITENGLTTKSTNGSSELKWPGIVKIQQSKNYILVYYSERSACVIPKRAFTDKAEADRFYTYSHRLWENNKKMSA